VEVVRQVHAAFGRGDLEAFLSCWQPDAKYRAAITQMVEGEAGDFHGHDGLRRWWRDLHDLYQSGVRVLHGGYRRPGGCGPCQLSHT
jgi:ketosteroid isomerase-like protein